MQYYLILGYSIIFVSLFFYAYEDVNCIRSSPLLTIAGISYFSWTILLDIKRGFSKTILFVGLSVWTELFHRSVPFFQISPVPQEILVKNQRKEIDQLFKNKFLHFY